MIYYCSTEVIYLVKLFRQCIQQKWVKTTSPNPVKSVEKEKKIDFFQRIFIRTLDDSGCRPKVMATRTLHFLASQSFYFFVVQSRNCSVDKFCRDTTLRINS